MYARFHHPPPTSSDRTHRHTRTSKYPLPRIPSSELHGNHSLTPITMATGIGITHAFLLTNFLFVWCVCPCTSPFQSHQLPPSHFPFICVLTALIFQRGDQPKHNNLLIQSLSQRRPVRFSGELVAVVRLVVHLQIRRQSALERHTDL